MKTTAAVLSGKKKIYLREFDLPEIGEEAPFKNNIYEAWLRVPVKGVCK